MKRNKFLPAFLLSIIFFVLGQLLFTPLFNLFEPHVEGIEFQVLDVGDVFKTSIALSLGLSLIPVLIWLTWRLAPIVSARKKIASVLTVAGFVIMAVWIRHQAVKSYFISITHKINLPKDLTGRVSYPINPIVFVYYIMVGCCIGCIISYLLFREKAPVIKGEKS